MQELIVSLWQEHGFTVLLVTHDVSEAVAMADRVLLIEDGKIGLDLTVDIAATSPDWFRAFDRTGSRGVEPGDAAWRQ